MLHTDGDRVLGHWVRVLPRSCLPLAVTATLTRDHSHLHIQHIRTNRGLLWLVDDLDRVAAAVEALQSRVLSLHIGHQDHHFSFGIEDAT